MIETRSVAVPGTSGEPANIAVHVTGSGPLAVLIHGFPLDHRMWLDVMSGDLARRRTLCAIDLRGHGQSPWCGDDVHTMERLADDVAAVIASFGDGPADVGCLSMGGYVTFALHARHPERIRSLVLSNTPAAADTDEQRAARDLGIETAKTSGATAVADIMIPNLVGPDAYADLRARLREMIEAVPVESIVADQRGMQQRPDRRSTLASIDVPTLVVAGDQDVIMRQEEAELMANEIPNASLAVIPGTGHMSPMEAPEAWTAAVGKFWP